MAFSWYQSLEEELTFSGKNNLVPGILVEKLLFQIHSVTDFKKDKELQYCP